MATTRDRWRTASTRAGDARAAAARAGPRRSRCSGRATGCSTSGRSRSCAAEGVHLSTPTATTTSTPTTTSRASATPTRTWSRRSPARRPTLNTHTRYAARADPRLRRAPARDATRRPRQRHVHVHRQRGERPGAARGPFAHGREGVIVTRNAYHGVTSAAAEISPTLGANVPLGATCAPCRHPARARRAGGRPRLRRASRRRSTTSSATAPRVAPRHRQHPLDRRDPRRPAGLPRPRSRSSARPAGLSSRTRCSPDSAAPATRCGAPAPRPRPRPRHAGQADGQRPAGRRAVARPEVSRRSGRPSATSTPSAATRSRSPPRPPCWT